MATAIATQLGQQVPQRNGKLYEADYQHLVANNNDVELPGVERDQTGPHNKESKESRQHLTSTLSQH